jgi:hypothetical protein
MPEGKDDDGSGGAVKMKGDGVERRRRRASPADDEHGAEGEAEDEGDVEHHPGETEGTEDEPHQVEGRWLDGDPGDDRLDGQRTEPPSATVDPRRESVNWRVWVRLRASRYAWTPPRRLCARISR